MAKPPKSATTEALPATPALPQSGGSYEIVDGNLELTADPQTAEDKADPEAAPETTLSTEA